MRVLMITKGIKSNPVMCHDFDSSPYTQKKMIKFENWQVSVSCLHKFQDPKDDKTGSHGRPYLQVLIIPEGIKSNPVTFHDFDTELKVSSAVTFSGLHHQIPLIGFFLEMD